MEIIKVNLETHSDDRGSLTVVESNKNIPFEIKRVYYMYDTFDGFVRGKHAHKNLQQILVCVNGSCKVSLDDGKEKKIVTLSKPNEGLYISNNIWREMYDFDKGTVLLSLASEFYNESDYIRDYNEFLRYIKQ